MDTDPNNIIKNRITELLSIMGFSAKGSTTSGGDSQIFERAEEGRIVFNIRTSDAQLLIGKQGANLEALQHVVRLLVKKDIPPDFSFALDIDDYRDKRVIYLKELSRKAAHQVRQTNRSVALVPMPSFERKIVHDYLSLFSDIVSESMGEDPARRVIIKYKQKAPDGSDPFNFIENL